MAEINNNFKIIMYQTEDGLTKIESTFDVILFGYSLTEWRSCFSEIKPRFLTI